MQNAVAYRPRMRPSGVDGDGGGRSDRGTARLPGQLAWGDTNGPIWVNAALAEAIASGLEHPPEWLSRPMTTVLLILAYSSGTDGPGESWFGFLIAPSPSPCGRAERDVATLYGAAAPR
jgi:hypothetical protein